MQSFARGLVSKKKRRYKENGFDLDLSCKSHCPLKGPDSSVHSLPTILQFDVKLPCPLNSILSPLQKTFLPLKGKKGLRSGTSRKANI